jgi:hypothetical protein
MSCKLRKALMRLFLESETDSMMEEVNVLIANYTEKEFQEAVLEKDNNGWLPIHYACWVNVHVEVIRMLLDSDDDKKLILVEDIHGCLPIHYA